MCLNSIIGFITLLIKKEINDDSWGLFWVNIPVVVIVCPLGAYLSSFWHRMVFAILIYLIEPIQFLSAWLIIKPWEKSEGNSCPLALSSLSIALVFTSLLYFCLLSKIGDHLLRKQAFINNVNNRSMNHYQILDDKEHYDEEVKEDTI